MPQEPHIFLDMDGVLVDFVGGVAKEFNADLSELDHWNINKALCMSATDFWTRLQENKRFWAELEAYPWTRELVHTCLDLTGGNVTIATSPTMDVNCASQKMYWIGKFFPQFNRTMLIGPQKHLLAKQHHILIDDSQKNCDKFEEYGGRAIVFPQLWNSTKQKPDFSVVDEIREALLIHLRAINEQRTETITNNGKNNGR